MSFYFIIDLDEVAFYPECYWYRIVVTQHSELSNPGRAFQIFLIA